MNPDREQAYELVASQPEISLDAATVREIVEEYNCDDSPHFLATVHLAERVIQLERALRGLMKYCPLSGDLAVMIRSMQGGGTDAAARADRLVEHDSHLDEAQDAARAALERT